IVTDEYNQTETADIYYYTSKDHNNVLYAGFCWEIVRTTTTGGVKLIYNGVPDSSGTCTISSTYNGETGIVGDSPRLIDLRYEYWYGDSFDYDENTKVFTIKGTKYKGTYYGDSNKDNYLRKYTCKSNDENNACSTMYYISSVGTSDDMAFAAPYTIQNNVFHGNIAFSNFNSNRESLAFVGYMYNTTYISNQGTTPTSIFANDVTWNSTTKQYELSSDTSTSYDDTHHYSCNDENCSSVRFFYYRFGPGTNSLYYVILENGKNINDALYDMIGYVDPNSTNKQPNANLNKYDSAAKSIIDWWFEKYIQNQQDVTNNDYADYLEDVVYCNDRSVSDIAGWSPNSDITGRIDPRLYFNTYNYHVKSTLECPNITDQFSISNTYARLKYPVGLLTAPEANLMTDSFRGNRAQYWLGSPSQYGEMQAEGNTTGMYGGFYQGHVTNGNIGLRPVVSLKPGTEISNGDGTLGNPFVIGKPSENPNPNPNPNPENPDVYTVTYQYVGEVPETAPALSETNRDVSDPIEYAKDTQVDIKEDILVKGYKFNGWKVKEPSDLNVTNNSFNMPSSDVIFEGSFTKLDSYTVSYKINGEVPNGYQKPSDKEYYADELVSLDILQKGDVYKGYVFKGW
ncbi:MAG: hypothetical protein K2H53_02700, partial [Clostridia bacterium]|nr:hypothetical protein [Clostridia bacterium]